MIDEIWVGRFEWQGVCVRMSEDVNRGTPVVEVPLTPGTLRQCLEECKMIVQSDDGQPKLPTEWMACFHLGFLTFNRDLVRQDSVRVIRCLVEKHRCEVVYAQSGLSFTVQEVEEYAQKLDVKAAAKVPACMQ